MWTFTKQKKKVPKYRSFRHFRHINNEMVNIAGQAIEISAK